MVGNIVFLAGIVFTDYAGYGGFEMKPVPLRNSTMRSRPLGFYS
jgi:hypothetical protein